MKAADLWVYCWVPVYLPSVRFWISFFTNSWYTEFITSSSETKCASLYSRTEFSPPHWLQFHHMWSNVLPVAYGSIVKYRIPYPDTIFEVFLRVTAKTFVFQSCLRLTYSAGRSTYLVAVDIDITSGPLFNNLQDHDPMDSKLWYCVLKQSNRFEIWQATW